jgi:uncharacterized UPF0160 family protein
MQKSNKAESKKTKAKTIVTHGANFHADDLFGTVAALMYVNKTKPQEKWKVVRSLDPKVWAAADVLLDIGFEYDPKRNRFDHHQKGGAGERESGAPYAAFGLVWKKFGKTIAGSQELADYVDRKLIAGMDAFDNGVDTYTSINKEARPYLLVHYLKAEAGAEGNKPKDKQDYDKVFKDLMPLAKRIIEITVEKGKRSIQAKKIIGKAYAEAQDKRIVITEKFAPRDFNDYPDVLFYIYTNPRGNWAVETVPLNEDTTETRVSLPKKWRGLRDEELAKVTGISDAVFCHASGFLGGAKSKESAIRMAEMAIEIGDKA